MNITLSVKCMGCGAIIISAQPHTATTSTITAIAVRCPHSHCGAVFYINAILFDPLWIGLPNKGEDHEVDQ